MKQNFVSSIQVGEKFDSIFLLDDIVEKETKNGKPYWLLKLTDRTGTIAGKVWDATAWPDPLENGQEIPLPTRGEYVKVRAEAGAYKGVPDLTIRMIRGLDPEKDAAEFDYADFVPVGPENRFKLMETLEVFADSIRNPGLHAVIKHLFTDPALHMAFRDCPAAAGVHQAYIGGLAEHVHHMLNIAVDLSQQYELSEESLDLLMAACFLHDIGKIKELKWSTGIGYTDEGLLIGHIGLGFEILQQLKPIYWTAIETEHGEPATDPKPKEGDLRGLDWKKKFDHHANLWMHLRHLVASHHGRAEWRALTTPASREAQLFHLIDMVDSRMGIMDQVEQKETFDPEGFTAFNYKLEARAWKMPQ